MSVRKKEEREVIMTGCVRRVIWMSIGL